MVVFPGFPNSLSQLLLVRVKNHSQRPIKRQIALLIPRSIRLRRPRCRFPPLQLHTRPEDHAVGTPSKMEHPQLITLLDRLSFSNSKLAFRDFCHANVHDSHEPDGAVRLDVDDSTSRNGGDIRLGIFRRRWVWSSGVDEPLEGALAVVCPGNQDSVDNGPVHGRSPAMVTQRAEKGLVDGPASELLDVNVIAIQHAVERVRLAFEEDIVRGLDPLDVLQRRRLARVVEQGVLTRLSNGADACIEVTCEELFPGLEAEVIRVTRVRALVQLDECLRSASDVGPLSEEILGWLAKPAVGGFEAGFRVGGCKGISPSLSGWE